MITLKELDVCLTLSYGQIGLQKCLAEVRLFSPSTQNTCVLPPPYPPSGIVLDSSALVYELCLAGTIYLQGNTEINAHCKSRRVLSRSSSGSNGAYSQV